MKIEKIAIISHDRVLYINIYDILFCQSEGSSINIHLVDGSIETIIKPFSKLQSILPAIFVRVTQCIIVNKLHIDRIEKKDKIIVLRNHEIKYTLSLGKLLSRIGKISNGEINSAHSSSIDGDELSLLEIA
jgi:DNA-binding LytR/AlgR family response regulator